MGTEICSERVEMTITCSEMSQIFLPLLFTHTVRPRMCAVDIPVSEVVHTEGDRRTMHPQDDISGSE